jgi:hypothetical protein
MPQNIHNLKQCQKLTMNMANALLFTRIMLSLEIERTMRTTYNRILMIGEKFTIISNLRWCKLRAHAKFLASVEIRALTWKQEETEDDDNLRVNLDDFSHRTPPSQNAEPNLATLMSLEHSQSAAYAY